MIFFRLLPILGITFIDILGFSIMIALLPFFVRHFHAPPVVVGLTFSIFAACQFLAGPIWGHVSDRTGRKLVLIISQVGATISWCMLAFAPNLTVVCIARALEGASGGNLSITHAYVADLIEPEKRARAFAYIGAAFSAGMIFGPAFGGILLDHFGYSAPFLAAAGLQILTLILTIFRLPESRSRNDEAPTDTIWQSILPALRDRVIGMLLWQRLCYALALYGWFSVFNLVLAAQLHYRPAQISYLFAAFGVASICFELGLVGRIAERLGDQRTATCGLVLSLLTLAVAPLIGNIGGAILMLVLFAGGLAITDATLPSMLSKAAPEDRKGTILGVGSSLESLAGIIMPPLSTGTLQLFGVAQTALLSGVLVIAALAVGFIPRADTSDLQSHIA